MANEKRLIDVNDALERLRKVEPKLHVVDFLGFKAVDIDAFIRFLESQKTVDAVEVVHGRWEDEHGGKYANPRYRCSVCKKRALYKFERDLLDNWKEVQALTPNCPYCMAKLDGGIDHDI